MKSCKSCKWAQWPIKLNGKKRNSGHDGICTYVVVLPAFPSCVHMHEGTWRGGIFADTGRNCPCHEAKEVEVEG